MNSVFRNRVLDLMEKNNEKQLGLAQDLGMTQATLSRNINGVHRPKAEVVERIAKHYNVTTDYLLGITNNPNAVKLNVADVDGYTTSIEYELINKMAGFTIDDFKKVDEYIDFLKMQKEKDKNKNEK